MKDKHSSAARTISSVMLLTLIGKVLGLYRDRLLAIHYSVGVEANAFFTASRIPRVFFDAVFASAIAACFIPVFSRKLEQEGRAAAFRFAGNFISVIGLLTALLTGLGMLFPQALVAVFADYQDPETVALAASLTRVMFPTVLFSGLAFSFVGVLQALDHFTAPALMSAVSNLVIIGYFLFFDRSAGIYGLAGAYLLGWLLQGVIQIPPLRQREFAFRPDFSPFTDGMKQVFALMGPVMVSTWVQPINLVINSRFGSRLYEGAGVAALEYSSNLYLVIAGTFILSITNVIFPRLSRMTAGDRQGEFRDTLRQTTHSSLFFVLPMSAGLMAVARPLVSFLYGGGSFDAFSVDITVSALVWMSLGMAGYAVQNILSRAYFARQDGRVPLLAGLASIGVNILLCSLLSAPFSVAGLAFSSAVSTTVYALLLLLPLQKGEDRVADGRTLADLAKMLVSAAATGIAAWGTCRVFTALLPAGKAGELMVLGLCAGVGVVVYFLCTALMGLPETKLMIRMLKSAGKES